MGGVDLRRGVKRTPRMGPVRLHAAGQWLTTCRLGSARAPDSRGHATRLCRRGRRACAGFTRIVPESIYRSAASVSPQPAQARFGSAGRRKLQAWIKSPTSLRLPCRTIFTGRLDCLTQPPDARRDALTVAIDG